MVHSRQFSFNSWALYATNPAINPGKCFYMTFGLNTTKNRYFLEDGAIVPFAEEHVG